MMEDNKLLLMVICFCIVGLGLFIGIIVGTKIEESYIYNKCLETNKTMIHQDAVKLCQEIIR